MSKTTETLAVPQGAAAPDARHRPAYWEGLAPPSRPAAVTCGVFTGWLAAGVCKMGIIAGILGAFGVSGYVDSQDVLTLGWTPVVGLFSIAVIFVFSFVLNRRVFVTQPRDVAMRSYWSVVRTTAFTAGAVFAGYVLIAMTVIYGVGGGDRFAGH